MSIPPKEGSRSKFLPSLIMVLDGSMVAGFRLDGIDTGSLCPPMITFTK